MSGRGHWQTVYETKSLERLSWYQAAPEPSLAALDRLGAGPGPSLIDIGGGASTLADTLLALGWRDLAVLDIAGSALGAAKARLGDKAAHIEWIQADVTDWRPPRPFDIWHDRAAFHFLTGEEQRAGYRRALDAGTAPGSHVILATFAPDGPEMCSGLPVRRYDAAGVAAELGPGFAPVEDWRETHVTPWGADQNFQWAVFRRTGSGG